MRVEGLDPYRITMTFTAVADEGGDWAEELAPLIRLAEAEHGLIYEGMNVVPIPPDHVAPGSRLEARFEGRDD